MTDPALTSRSSDIEASSSTDEARALVLAAFEQARVRGKADWNVMTVAVLKNRILQIAGRDFDLHKYGASTMTELVRGMPDLVEVDIGRSPPVVHLTTPSSSTPADGSPPPRIDARTTRIRGDLFSAMLDYSNVGGYMWDLDRRAVVRLSEGEGPILPTVTPDELHSWRSSFVEKIRGEGRSIDLSALEIWAEQSLSSHFLPKPLQGEWNAELKRLVFSRLVEWFAAEHRDPPPDLLSTGRAQTAPSVDEAERLRAFAIAVVGAMTVEELRNLTFPVGSVMRTQSRPDR